MPKMRLFDPDRGPDKDGSPYSVADVVDSYLRQDISLRERPFDDRRHVLELFCSQFGDMRVTEGKPIQLREWIMSQPTWKSNWTRRRAAGTIRACFNWATRLKLIAENPFAGVTFPHGDRGEPIEPAEFQAMLRASTPVFRRFLIALRYTGARTGEIAKSEWRHLDMVRQCIVLKEHKTRAATGKPRRIILHPVVIKLLDWIRRHGPNPRFMFVNAKGWNWTAPAIHWRIEQIREKAGVRKDATCYGCRHLFLTQAVLAGVDIATVSALAGHSRIATTAWYLHVAGKTDHLKAAIQQVFRKPT